MNNAGSIDYSMPKSRYGSCIVRSLPRSRFRRMCGCDCFSWIDPIEVASRWAPVSVGKQTHADFHS